MNQIKLRNRILSQGLKNEGEGVNSRDLILQTSAERSGHLAFLQVHLNMQIYSP